MESKDIELEVPPEDQHGSSQDPPLEKAHQEGEEEGEDEFDFGPAVYDENLYGGLGLDILSFLINFMKIDICSCDHGYDLIISSYIKVRCRSYLINSVRRLEKEQ